MPRKSMVTEDQSGQTPVSGRLKPERFWQAARAYQPRDGVTYRLYRLWPQIDRALTGHEDSAIDIQTEMDEDYILQHHGSGDYQIFLHDANRPRGQTEVCHAILELRHPNFPPVVDPAELVWGAPKNRGYIEGLKARGKLPASGPEAPKSDAAAAVVSEALGFARDAMRQPSEAPGARQAIELVTEGYKTIMAQQLDPLGTLAKAKELLGGAGEMRAIMEMFAKLVDRQTEILLRVMERSQAAQPAPGISQINELLDLAERLRPAAGGGLRQWLPPLVSAAAAALQAIASLRQPAAQAPPAAPVPATPPAGEVEDLGVPAMPNVPADKMRLFVEVAQRAIQVYKLGVSGDAFAESIERRYGPEVVQEIANLGTDTILLALRSVPQVCASLADQWAGVRTFIEDFIGYARADEAQASGSVQ